MDREALKSIIEKQKTVLSLALGNGLRSPDIRVDEVVAENSNATIDFLNKLLELPVHPDPEINKEVNADIREGEEADKAAGLPPQDFSEMFVSSIDDNWLPTAANINRLPEPLRLYIHDLETKCDPGGDVQTIASQKDQIGGLTNKVKELEEVVGRLMATKGMSPPGSGHVIGAAIILRDLPPDKQVALQCIIRNMQRLEEDIDIKKAECDMLTSAIENHKNQKGDDRCWLDDAELYAAAGLKGANTALPPLEEFISNCKRFHASRQNPEHKYVTVEELIEAAGERSNKAFLDAHHRYNIVLTQKDVEIEQLKRKVRQNDRGTQLTIRDLSAAVKVQRTFGDTKSVGGRHFASSTKKYILPALKRLGWKPTKKEAEVGARRHRNNR